jgi:hypothetical protein
VPAPAGLDHLCRASPWKTNRGSSGRVGPAQLDAARIRAPDAQAMVARVEVHPDEQLTARFPQELGAKQAHRGAAGDR